MGLIHSSRQQQSGLIQLNFISDFYVRLEIQQLNQVSVERSGPQSSSEHIKEERKKIQTDIILIVRQVRAE